MTKVERDACKDLVTTLLRLNLLESKKIEESDKLIVAMIMDRELIAYWKVIWNQQQNN